MLYTHTPSIPCLELLCRFGILRRVVRMDLRKTSREAWIKSIPRSQLAYPDTLVDRIKYLFWKFITPFHPHVRDFLCYAKILRTQGRQNYLLGRLAPGETVESFVEFLLERGFGNHFIALTDEGQLVSLRYTPNFQYQYHVRIFEDGEVRGHYEPTPEHAPIRHMSEGILEDRFEEFMALFGHKIIPATVRVDNSYTWSFLGDSRL